VLNIEKEKERICRKKYFV